MVGELVNINTCSSIKFIDNDSDLFISVMQTDDCVGFELWCYPYTKYLMDYHLFDSRRYPGLESSRQ